MHNQGGEVKGRLFNEVERARVQVERGQSCLLKVAQKLSLFSISFVHCPMLGIFHTTVVFLYNCPIFRLTQGQRNTSQSHQN